MHLKGMPRITMTCKALELDYAVAMVGFETRGGMSVPCFDGVVVCEEHAGLIKDAYHTAERCRRLQHIVISKRAGTERPCNACAEKACSTPEPLGYMRVHRCFGRSA